jgi:hypothetical protein
MCDIMGKYISKMEPDEKKIMTTGFQRFIFIKKDGE